MGHLDRPALPSPAWLCLCALLGCSSSSAPVPTSSVESPVAPTTAPSPSAAAPPAPETVTETAPPPAPETAVPAPAPTGAAPTDPSPLGVARAHCEHGWERFGEGAIDEASREIDAGLAVLRELALSDAAARSPLGACEYNHGRVAEAQGRTSEARGAYERSILYRENATVLARWRTLAAAGASPPETAPGSLFPTALAQRQRVCGGEPRSVDAPGWAGRRRPTCGVEILDVAMDGTDRGAAALALFSGYDPDEGDASVRWTFPLFVLADGHWRQVRALFAPDAGNVLDRYEVDLEARELTGAAPAEIVAHVSYAETNVPSGDDGGYSYEGMVVCGRLDQPAPACADLATRSDDSEEDEGGPDWSDVQLGSDGTVVVLDHRDGDDGDEVTRRETTLDALWGAGGR